MRLLTFLALLAWSPRVLAQTAPDSAACRTALEAPTRDTDIVRVSLTITTYDAEHPLPAAYSALLHDAFRQA